MKRFAITYLTRINVLIDAPSLEDAQLQARRLLKEGDQMHTISEIKDEPDELDPEV